MTNHRSVFLASQFEPINKDARYFQVGIARTRKERREIDPDCKACNIAFAQFEKRRGEIISHSIGVEKELDRVIASYFVPPFAKPKEPARSDEASRRKAFIDFVLGKDFTFSAKASALASIMSLAEIKNDKISKCRRILAPVMEMRNQFAHQRVAIDWKDRSVALWDSKVQKWGFVFKNESGKVERLERIPDDIMKRYSSICKSAIESLRETWSDLADLHGWLRY